MDDQYSSGAPSGWVGWISFASLMAIISGTLGAISGLAAIIRDETYVQVAGRIWIFDETSWGWIQLILGLALAAVGIMMLQGRTVGLALGAGVVTLHLLGHFSWMAIYPWWALVLMAFDVLILYALIVHGGEVKR